MDTQILALMPENMTAEQKMTHEFMKILIINQPLNNRGDESAHRAIVGAMLSHIDNISIRVLFLQANEDSVRQFSVLDPRVEYINETIVSPIRWKYLNRIWKCVDTLVLGKTEPTFGNLLRHYEWADAVVCAPGGICMGGFQSWGHLFYLRLAEYAGKPLAYYGRSFGPFPETTWLNRRFKSISKKLLQYFSFISIRDRKTEGIAQAMGVPYVQTVDSAFLESPVVAIPSEIKEKIGTGDYFVFVPNLLIWHPDYKGKLSKADIIRFYSDMLDCVFETFPNLMAVMLPQTFNYANPDDNDVNLFHEIETHKHDSRVIVIGDTYSSDIQQTIISHSSFMLGARYHSVVFALNNAVPFIALSYEHKISGLLEALEKTDCMVEIHERVISYSGRSHIINEVCNKIRNLYSDVTARDTAKYTAEAAFKRFKDWLHGYE